MKSLYFKLRDSLFVNSLTHALPGVVRPFILCYHQIDSAEFESHLLALKKKFRIVDLQTFVSSLKQEPSGPYCALTLDDCLEKDMEKAVAMCLKHEVPITFFLPVRFALRNQALPGTKVQRFLEEKKSFVLNGLQYQMTPATEAKIRNKVFSFFDPGRLAIQQFDDQVKEWYADNKLREEDIVRPADKVIEISKVKALAQEKLLSFQSHTYSHESLSLITEHQIRYELAESKRLIEDTTEKVVSSLCYPYGSRRIVGDKVLDIVKEFYESGFSLTQGVCTKYTDQYFMPRIGIYPGDHLPTFLGKIYHYMTAGLFYAK